MPTNPSHRTILLPRIPLQIRPAEMGDVERLRWSNGDDGKRRHEERLMRQSRGEALYYLAVVHDYPVGHAFLRWTGTEAALSVPMVEDLRVFEPFQGLGVGAALLDACEQACQERGFSRLGLTVEIENARARAFFERFGYRVESTLPDREGSASSRGEDVAGTVRNVVYMQKVLPQGVAPKHRT